MGSIIALLVIISSVYFIVLIGTIAYQLTGLDWETAQFQALSAFTMAGFTTRSSERVVNDPDRRKITMALIGSGYAATATVIATLVSSVSHDSMLISAVNLIMLAVTTAAAIGIIRRMGGHPWFVDPIRRFLAKRMRHERVPHEELMFYRHGFALSRVEVPPESRLAGQALCETDLREHKLQVLAIERDGEVIPVPSAQTIIQPYDHLVIYGMVESLREAFAPQNRPVQIVAQA